MPGCIYRISGSTTLTSSRYYVSSELNKSHVSGHYARMTWDFVSRAEQVEYVRQAILSRRTGSIVVTGEPGMGRTTFLARALTYTDPGLDKIMWLTPSSDTPFATLRAGDGWVLPDSVTAKEAVEMVADILDSRRLVVAVDDAQLMDYSSLFVLRGLVRRKKALLLVTRPLLSGRLNSTDPTSCLAHDRDTRTIMLLPMSMGEVSSTLARVAGGRVSVPLAEAAHAVTKGNPSLLRALVVQTQVAPAVRAKADGRCLGVEQMVEAAWEAWRSLALERAERLCQLAMRCGAAEQVAPIWAMLLLLRGHVAECTEFLKPLVIVRSLSPRLAVVHALAIALGSGHLADASDFLLASASHTGKATGFLLAFRAWILAVGGQEALATEALMEISRSDRETALFVHAAKAVLAELGGQRNESVFHLRRAIASSEGSSDDYPWIRPYLHASLIDALMLCGRVKEAASVAQNFHAYEPSSGWDIAVSLDTLIKRHEFVSDDPCKDESGSCTCRSACSGKNVNQNCARSHTRVCASYTLN